MSLKAKVGRLEKQADRVRPRTYVVVDEDEILRDHPEYRAFAERIAALDQRRMTAPLPECETYRQAQLREMESFAAWKEAELRRVWADVRALRWPDDEVILLTHRSPRRTPGGGPAWKRRSAVV